MYWSLLTIFFFSGVSSLIYQITWQRLLTVYYGVGAVSMTLIVSIYMLGMGLGALIGGKVADKQKNPISLYFWIELGIGIFGLISFPLILAIGKTTAGSHYVLAAVYETLFLLIPTFLMGMSLPVIIKIFEGRIDDLSKSISHFYFVNTLGAAFGAIIASYILISFYGIDTAIYAAALINLVLAAGVLATGIFRVKKQLSVHKPTVINSDNFASVPILVFITGFLAIGYEIIWFRIIGVLVKSSPYAFASILAVYLTGIAIGSFIIGKFIPRLPAVRRIKLFYCLQVLIALSVAFIFISYCYLTSKTSFGYLTQMSFAQVIHPPVHLFFGDMKPESFGQFVTLWFRLGTVFLWPLLFLFLPTVLMGASFPLIISIVSKDNTKMARMTGRVYFYSIAGNVAGGLITGLVLLGYIGSERTILLFVLTGLLFALPLLIDQKSISIRVVYALIAVIIFCIFPPKGEFYRILHPQIEGYTRYITEGRDGVVMTYVKDTGEVQNFINGDSHGGRPGYMFYVQVVEALAVVNKPENVLIIGYGTGSITEGVLKIPGIKKVTVVELNETLLRNLSQIPLFQNLMSDPRLQFIIDDGRRFLHRTNEKYDIVFMSPLRATSAYSNNIYSQQFFELIAKKLSASGIFVAWTDSVAIGFRTLQAVYPSIQLHTAIDNSQGFFISANHQLPNAKSIAQLQPLLKNFDSEHQQRMIDVSSGFKVISKEDLQKILNGDLVAQDWKPWSEYYLKLWLKHSNSFKKRQATR